MVPNDAHDQPGAAAGKAPGQGAVPDPDPATSPTAGASGPGGGVEPGETPPEADQVSAPQGHDEHGPHPAQTWMWIGGIGVVVVLVALIFVGYATGLWD
ncbi:DUF6480 family protein [Xylanimonas oleitrophica]|nr:DUF6480 family protein [Xylanimonas oleitrophica]